jgi:hypothetical protein
MGEFPSKENQFSSDNQPEKNGRPKGKSFKAVLEAMLDLECSEEDLKDEEIKKIFNDASYKPTNRDIISARMLIKAKQDAESKSSQRIADRVDGKPIETIKQSTEITTDKKIILSLDGKDIELGK